MTGSILIVDDEPQMRTTLVRYLTSEGFTVMAASSGSEMNSILSGATIDLVVLDLGLRNETGLDLLRKLRETQDLAVVILTGKSDPIDRVVGLELGADDYITKPFLNRELLARIKAVIRRVKPGASIKPQQVSEPLKAVFVNGWRIDLIARTLTSPDQRPVILTSAEYDILVELVENAGKTVDRNRLMEVAHRRSWTQSDRSVDIHVHNLRKKMAAFAGGSNIIVAMRNVGYMVAAEILPQM